MARATIEILRATRPDVIFDRSYFSMWAYGQDLSGQDVSYMPELIAPFDRASSVMDPRLAPLTAGAEELARRSAHEPDLYFSLELIQAANARFPSLLPLLPNSLPRLHIDTTDTSPDDAFSQVEDFLRS